MDSRISTLMDAFSKIYYDVYRIKIVLTRS